MRPAWFPGWCWGICRNSEQKCIHPCRHATRHMALSTAEMNSTCGEDITSVLLSVFQGRYESALGLQPHQPPANRQCQ